MHISSYNLTSPISRVLIGQYLIFCSRRHQRAVTRLENVLASLAIILEFRVTLQN